MKLSEDIDSKTIFRAIKNRTGGFQDENWLSLVREYECVKCGCPPPSEAHHWLGSVGTKRSAYLCIPVCHECHHMLTNDPPANRQAIIDLVVFLERVLRETMTSGD